MFDIIKIKSNVCNVTIICNRFVQNLNKIYINVVNDIFNYLKIHDDLKVVYEKNQKKDFEFRIYCNVNYDNNLIIKKFIDVYVVIFNKKSIN